MCASPGLNRKRHHLSLYSLWSKFCFSFTLLSWKQLSLGLCLWRFVVLLDSILLTSPIKILLISNVKIESLRCQVTTLNLLHVLFNPLQSVYYWLLFIRWGNWGTKGLNNMPRSPHLNKDGTSFWINHVSNY